MANKSFAVLLVTSLVTLILTIILCVCTITLFDFDFPMTSKITDDVQNMENNPGAGEYLLIFGTISLLGDFGVAIAMLIIGVLIPASMLFSAFVSQAIAMLFQIGKEKKWKIITGLIFTYISVAINILTCLLLTSLSMFNIIFMIITIVLNIVAIVLYIRKIISITKYLKTFKNEENLTVQNI